MPAVFGAVHRPLERGGIEIVVSEVAWRFAFEKEFDDGSNAMPGGPVQSRAAVLTATGYRESSFEKVADGGPFPVARGVGNHAVIFGPDLREEIWRSVHEFLNWIIIPEKAVVADELDVGRAAVEEERYDVWMMKFFCDAVRGDVAAEGPEIDCAAGAGVGHRKGFVVDALANCLGIF